MKSFTNEDFLRLIEELDDIDNYDEDYGSEPEFTWVPADPLYKKKFKSPTNGSGSNLTNTKKESIKEALFQGTIFQVGIFTIKITKYSSDPDDKKTNQDLKVDLSLLQEIKKTPSGAPCKMQNKIHLKNDSRFTNCAWLKYIQPGFDSSKLKDVPMNEVVDIIRWLQGLTRMSAFI